MSNKNDNTKLNQLKSTAYKKNHFHIDKDIDLDIN